MSPIRWCSRSDGCNPYSYFFVFGMNFVPVLRQSAATQTDVEKFSHSNFLHVCFRHLLLEIWGLRENLVRWWNLSFQFQVEPFDNPTRGEIPHNDPEPPRSSDSWVVFWAGQVFRADAGHVSDAAVAREGAPGRYGTDVWRVASTWKNSLRKNYFFD